MVQDGVAIFAIFQLIDSKKDPGIFAVGTTHLYYRDEGARKDQVKVCCCHGYFIIIFFSSC